MGFKLIISVDSKTLRNAVENINTDIVSLAENPQIKRNINAKYAELVSPWVPMKSGALRSEVSVSPDWATYHASSPYNGYQYPGLQYHETTFNHKGIETDHWDEVAKPYILDSLVAYAEKELERGIKSNG